MWGAWCLLYALLGLGKSALSTEAGGYITVILQVAIYGQVYISK